MRQKVEQINELTQACRQLVLLVKDIAEDIILIAVAFNYVIEHWSK